MGYHTWKIVTKNRFYASLYVLCSSQTRLRPLPVQTQGTQLLILFIQIYYNKSHQHLVNVTTEVSHSSMFTNSFKVFHKYLQSSLKILKITQKHKYYSKNSWGSYTATGSEITEGEQLPCNTHINRIYLWYDYIISPTRHREIVEIELHPEIDTKRFIKAKNQTQGVFTLKD